MLGNGKMLSCFVHELSLKHNDKGEEYMKNILVLEDDDNLREMLVLLLKENGYAAFGARSYKHALHLASRQEFAMIVSDIRLNGMDGLACIKLLKKNYPHIKTIVITGFAASHAIHRALEMEIDDFLYKPFDLELFLQTVKRVLGSVSEESLCANAFRSVSAYCRQFSRRLKDLRIRRIVLEIEQLREKCLKSYYMGMKTRLLTIGAALHLWDKLELLEKAVHLESCDLKAVADSYSYLIKNIANLVKGCPYEPISRSRGQKISRDDFSRIYLFTVEGLISCEEMQQALTIRVSGCQGDKGLESLSRRLWGDGTVIARKAL